MVTDEKSEVLNGSGGDALTGGVGKNGGEGHTQSSLGGGWAVEKGRWISEDDPKRSTSKTEKKENLMNVHYHSTGERTREEMKRLNL